MRALLLLVLALAGCSTKPPENAAAPQDLERAAIERGMVRNPKDSDIAGLYARDTDRVCIVPDGQGYRIGAFVDYGDGITCSGTGTASRVGETLHIELGEGGGAAGRVQQLHAAQIALALFQPRPAHADRGLATQLHPGR